MSLLHPIRSKTTSNRDSLVHISAGFDWFNGLFASSVIGRSDNFGFGFTTLSWNPLYRKDMIVIIWPAITGGLLLDALPPTMNVAVSVKIEQFSHINYTILRYFAQKCSHKLNLWTVQHSCTCWRSLHKSPWFLSPCVCLRGMQVHFDTINFDVWNGKKKK